jgi:hypothetical protein
MTHEGRTLARQTESRGAALRPAPCNESKNLRWWSLAGAIKNRQKLWTKVFDWPGQARPQFQAATPTPLTVYPVYLLRIGTISAAGRPRFDAAVTRAATRSAAARTGSCARSAYRSVVRLCVCHSAFPTM